MKDDKSYPFIAITSEDMPRIMYSRHPPTDASRWGPFPDAGAAKRTLKFGSVMRLNTGIMHKERNYKKKNTKENVHHFLIQDENNPSSIKHSLEMAKMNARYLLTMLPKSAWEQFNNLYIDFNSKKKPHSEDLYQIIGNSQRFFAIISDGMQRNDVFNFIKLGRFIERADMLSRIIEDQILRKENHVNKYYQNLQWSSVLRSINGFESFKLINKNNLNQEVVIRFMIMEKLFPRSLKYCVNKLLEVQKFLPKSPSIKNHMGELLENFTGEGLYIKDRKMLELLDDFQVGLINLDKDIKDKFFN